METLTIIFLLFLFFGIYFFTFFILILIPNRKKLFLYASPKKIYSLTFLVPAYNEQNTIEETINAVFKSNYPIKEVIVLDNNSTDKTSEIVKKLTKKYEKLKYFLAKKQGKANALNLGIRKAAGELIAITDADSYPAPDAVEKMIGFFNDKKIGAVTSCVFLRNNKTFFEKIQEIEYIVLAWTRKLLDFIDSVYVTNGPLSIYRKSILLKIGGFDPKSITEDIEVTWHILSLGYKTRMSLASKVYTTTPNKFRPWWRQRVRWGVGGIETIIKYKKFFFKKGMFGYFIIPFVSFIIIMSIIGFIFGAYILYRNITLNILYASQSISIKSSILRAENINTHPTIILIVVVILFILSFSYSTYLLKKMGQMHILKTRKVFNRLFYMLIYLTLYPVVWFDAIYRVIKKEHKW